jgi:hypothetical protein
MIKKNTTLISLELNFGWEGPIFDAIIGLCLGLEKNKTLRELYILGYYIFENEIEYLCRGLKTNTNIENLHFRFPRMCEKAPTHLAEMYKIKTNFKKIRIDCISTFSKGDMIQISIALRNSSSLLHICLPGCKEKCSSSDLVEMWKFVESNPGVQKLDLHQWLYVDEKAIRLVCNIGEKAASEVD